MSDNMYKTDEYLVKNPSWHTEDSAWKALQVLKMMKRNNLKPGSVCEIGCGAGEILNQLYIFLPGNVHFSGYEISPYAFELAKSRQKERLQFYLDDLSREKKATFDLCLAIDVLEHVADCGLFLSGIRQKAEYKIFHIPLDLSAQSVLRRSVLAHARLKCGHLHYFTKELALSMLASCGYEIIDHFYTFSSGVSSRRSVRSRVLNLFRRALYKFNDDAAVRLLGGYSLMVLAK